MANSDDATVVLVWNYTEPEPDILLFKPPADYHASKKVLELPAENNRRSAERFGPIPSQERT